MSKNKEQQQCKQMVWGGYREYRCTRNAVKDGYCKQHHPDAVEARRKASMEKYRKQLENSPRVKLQKLEVENRVLKEKLANSLAWIRKMEFAADKDKHGTYCPDCGAGHIGKHHSAHCPTLKLIQETEESLK